MRGFLLWIGLYNLIGAVAVLGCFSERFGDRLLRQWLQIVAEPYTHGAYGRLWIFWTAAANGFLGGVMVAATRWDEGPQREVTIGVVAVYAVSVIAAIAAAQSPRYRKSGLYFAALLWVAQAAWGVIAALR